MDSHLFIINAKIPINFAYIYYFQPGSKTMKKNNLWNLSYHIYQHKTSHYNRDGCYYFEYNRNLLFNWQISMPESYKSKWSTAQIKKILKICYDLFAGIH